MDSERNLISTRYYRLLGSLVAHLATLGTIDLQQNISCLRHTVLAVPSSENYLTLSPEAWLGVPSVT